MKGAIGKFSESLLSSLTKRALVCATQAPLGLCASASPPARVWEHRAVALQITKRMSYRFCFRFSGLILVLVCGCALATSSAMPIEAVATPPVQEEHEVLPLKPHE